MNLNLLKTFIKVAQFGSFTKAAQSLKQPKSRVSRHIAALEKDLGVELVKRTTRQTVLTQAGKDFFQKITAPLQELEDQVNIISDHQDEVSGLIRVTAPEDMAQTILKDVILEFESEYPKVNFEIVISNEYLDLTKENIDFGFRAGRLADSGLKHRKLLETKIILAASKEYLQTYGRPNTTEDLVKHKLLAFTSIGFENFCKDDLKLHPFFTCNSFPVLKSMAIHNKGIAILPEFYCKSQLEKGILEKVLPQHSLRSAPLQLVFSPTKNMPLRNRAFIEKTTQLLTKV